LYWKKTLLIICSGKFTRVCPKKDGLPRSDIFGWFNDPYPWNIYKPSTSVAFGLAGTKEKVGFSFILDIDINEGVFCRR